MAFTTISNIIDPEVLADQIAAKYPDKLVLGQSSLVAVNSTFPLGSPGTKFKIPFWKRMGTFGALTEGTAMTPTNITTGAEYATVLRAGAAYEVYDTAALVSMADPTAEISDQVSRRAAEYIDGKLVVEAEKSPNLHDISGTGAGTYKEDTTITAMTKYLGDNYQDLLNGGVIFMHSKVYNDLIITGAISNQYQSGNDVLRTGVLPTISGMPIVLSDRVTKTTVSSVDYYNSYIIGPEALGLFYQRQVQVEFDRDILLSADVIAATVHFAPHLFGYDDNGSSVVAEDNKSIHVVVVKTK